MYKETGKEIRTESLFLREVKRRRAIFEKAKEYEERIRTVYIPEIRR